MASSSPFEPASTKLIERAAQDVRELVRLELALANNEMLGVLAAVKTVAAAAVVLGLLSLASVIVALGLVLGPAGALLLALFLGAGGAASGVMAYRRFPKHLLAATRRRIADDEALVKKHLS